MYTFGTTIDNKYLQLTNTVSGDGFEFISNYERVDFDGLNILDGEDVITVNLVDFDIPNYVTSSEPKYNIEDNEVSYSSKPSFTFISDVDTAVYSILTGKDITNFDDYTFGLLTETIFPSDVKTLHTSGGKPIIGEFGNFEVKFSQLTGSQIHNFNHWITTNLQINTNNHSFDLNTSNDKPAFIALTQYSLDFYQLTGDNINGPYTQTEILTAIVNEEILIGSEMKFNSAGKASFITSIADSNSNYTLIYTELTGSNYQNVNDYCSFRFTNLFDVFDPKINFNNINGKPSIVYYSLDNTLNYLSLTGSDVNDITNWSNINLSVTGYNCSLEFQPENSFYPGAPVISYVDNNNYLNVIQLTGSNFYDIESEYWGNHSLGEFSEGGSYTNLRAVSSVDPIELAYIPLKNSLTYPIADVTGISYYDDTNDSLKYTQLTGNNFSDINSWGVYTVDNASVVGQYSSLQFVSGSSPAIAYHDNVTGDLKYAQLTGNNFDEQRWGILTLDSVNDTGEYTSLKIINNRPAISYINQTNNTLNYIELTGANFDQSSNWGKVIIDNISIFDNYTSLSLNSAFEPGVSYYDDNSNSLKIAQLTGTDFTNKDNWGVYTIPNNGNDVGKYTFLNYTSSNKPAVAYLDTTNNALLYSTLTGDEDSSWGTISLTNASSGKISLQFTPYNDKPSISFVTSNSKVGYIQLTGADVFNTSNWSVNELDRQSGSTSLQFSSAGAPGISNYNNDTKFLEYFQLTGVNFQDLSSFEQVDLNNENWGLVTIDSSGEVGQYNSLAFSQYEPINEYKLSADKLSAFDGETFSIKLSTNEVVKPQEIFYEFNNNNSEILPSSDYFVPTVIDNIFFDVTNVSDEEKITFTLPDLYNPAEGLNPDHSLDVYIVKTETVPVTALTAIPFDDESCNRIVLKELINPAKDITMSFQTNRDAVNLLTENNLVLLTEENIPLIGEFNIIDGSGFSIFLVEGEKPLDNQNGQPGPGLGILATNDTGFNPMSGHLLSIAFDLAGFYGVKNLFKDSGDRGYLSPRPYTITARVSNFSSEYDYISSTTFNESIFKYNTPIKCYRVRFREHLTRLYFDVKDRFEDRYTNLVSFDTNIDFANLPRGVKIGLSYSGVQNLPVKDITYSGEVY